MLLYSLDEDCCRYGLSAPEETTASTAEEEQEDLAGTGGSTAGDASGRRHLSVKERKLLKKQGTGLSLNGSETTGSGAAAAESHGPQQEAADTAGAPDQASMLLSCTLVQSLKYGSGRMRCKGHAIVPFMHNFFYWQA